MRRGLLGAVLVAVLASCTPDTAVRLPERTLVRVFVHAPEPAVQPEGARLTVVVLEPVIGPDGRVAVDSGALGVARVRISERARTAGLALVSLPTVPDSSIRRLRPAPARELGWAVYDEEGVHELSGAVVGALAGHGLIGGSTGTVIGGLFGAAAASGEHYFARVEPGPVTLTVGGQLWYDTAGAGPP